MDSFNDVFQEVLKYCRNCKSISEPGYNKWIKILEPMKLENNVAYLLTDSDFSRGNFKPTHPDRSGSG